MHFLLSYLPASSTGHVGVLDVSEPLPNGQQRNSLASQTGAVIELGLVKQEKKKKKKEKESKGLEYCF